MDKEGVVFTSLFDNNYTLLRHIKIYNNQLNNNINGDYIIYDVKHYLTMAIPGGKFFSEVKAYYLNGEVYNG